MTTIPLLVLLGGSAFGQIQQTNGAWRDLAQRLLQDVYRKRGVEADVRREALTSSAALPMSGIDKGKWKVKSVQWDALHQRSVIMFELRGKHPLVALSSDALPTYSNQTASFPVRTASAPVLLKAGEACHVGMTDGKLAMRLDAKALNSARMGGIARVRLSGEHSKILRTVVIARGEVEIVP
jgi:hypothetical protein